MVVVPGGRSRDTLGLSQVRMTTKQWQKSLISPPKISRLEKTPPATRKCTGKDCTARIPSGGSTTPAKCTKCRMKGKPIRHLKPADLALLRILT